MGGQQSLPEQFVEAARTNRVDELHKLRQAVLHGPPNDARKGRSSVGDAARPSWSAVLEHRVNGLTPLLHAANTGSLDAVRWLLTHGADGNAQDEREGNTACHLAVRGASAQCRRVVSHVLAALIEAGAKVRIRNRRGQTVLMLARSIRSDVVNASSALRTLEINHSLCHGLLGLEEHHDWARLAGSVVGLFGTQGQGLNAQNRITGVLGGKYVQRWCVLLSPAAAAEPEFAIYSSFQACQPITVIPAATAAIGPPQSLGFGSLQEKLARMNNVASTASASRTVTRFVLQSPLIGIRFESAARTDYEKWAAAFARASDGSAAPQGNGRQPSGDGSGGGGQQVPVEAEVVVATPVEDDGPPMAQAVVMGPAGPASSKVDLGPNAPTAPNVAEDTLDALPTPPSAPPITADAELPPVPPTAGLPAVPSAPPSSNPDGVDRSDIPVMIKELKGLLDMGAITQAEFEAKKNELLARY